MLGIGLWFMGVGKAALAWLSRRSLVEMACLALGLICFVQFTALRMEKRHSAKVEAQLVKCEQARKAMSDARNVQKAETRERIKVVTRTIKESDDKAKAIETAPLPGNCKTPKEILDADI
jgi:hypothetical protein